MSGALRIRSWGPGQVPPAIFAAHSLERIPGVERLSVCELGRFMIRPTLRGQALVPSLGAAGWELLAGEQRMDLVVLTCRPGLVDYYRRLGARTYGATMLPGPEGLEVPLLVVLSDQAWLKKIKSPLAGFANKYFGPGKRAPLDPAPFALARRG